MAGLNSEDAQEITDNVINQLRGDLSEEIKRKLIDDLASDIKKKIVEELNDELSPALAQEILDGQLESKRPKEALDQFREKKKKNVSRNSWKNGLSTKLDYMEEYLIEECGITNLSELTPKEAENYENWREHESSDRVEILAPKTLKDDMHLYKEFLEYSATRLWVNKHVPEAIEIPELDSNEGVDKEKLDPNRARSILTYLDKFEYASLDHVVILILCKTGRRPSGLRALDEKDFVRPDDPDENPKLNFVDRENTPLKKGELHEASIDISEETAAIIQDFLDSRESQVDEYGRQPLLATDDGRIGRSTIRSIAYKWTSPCTTSHNRDQIRELNDHDPKACPASNSVKNASKCELSASPSKFRSGFITTKLNNGASYEAVGYVVGATKETLKKHYDHPDDEEERQRYEDELEQASDPDSGYR